MTATDHTLTGPKLAGIQHVGLTVADVEAGAAWYQRVLGLERQFEEPHHRSETGGYAVVLGTPDMRLNVGLDHHPGARGRAVRPHPHRSRPPVLPGRLRRRARWAAHLDAEGIVHSGVYAVPGLPISLLTFCDPDGIQLELIAFAGDR